MPEPLTPGEKAERVRALRQIRSMLGVCREIADYNGVDDISGSLASLIADCEDVEAYYTTQLEDTPCQV